MKPVSGATIYVACSIFVNIAFLQISGIVAGVTDNATVTMATILREIFDGYDKTLPPKYDQVGFDRQITVGISVFIHSMFSLSEANMEYSISMFLRERWIDERLKYNDTINIKRLELDRFYLDSVWMPDMYILNEKDSDYHEVTVPNKLLHLYPDGTVQYSAKVTGIFSCLMYLHIYPFDTQMCKLEFESYGHSTENMKFIWGDAAITVAKEIQFPQFSLTNFSNYNCERDYYGILYPCVGIKFTLVRKYAYHMVQIYLPSVLTVILSWVNFWLDSTAVPARITLGLLTVLTMTTQSSGARENLPRVSYIKAIDVYMATCLAFVFLGLVEFAIVNVLKRADSKNAIYRAPYDEKHSENHKERDNSSRITFQQDEEQTRRRQYTHNATRCGFLSILSASSSERINPSIVDKISRVAFPGTFVLFNLLYWMYYFLADHNYE